MSKTVAKSEKPVQSWRPTPGCPACRRHVLMVLRGVSQSARRLQVDDSESKWMLRATHHSGDVRYPSDKRRSACTSARRLVRGSTDADASEEARSRPASCPGGGPQAEPPTPQEVSVTLKKRLSPHAMSGVSRDAFRPPAACVAERRTGKAAQVPSSRYAARA